MRTVKEITPTDPTAKDLLIALNQTLLKITDDDGTSSYDNDGFNPDTDVFLLMEENSQPVGCGAIRFVTETTCEIKRMFSIKKGVGGEILKVLEEKAVRLGYKYAILSTRLKNKTAISFYRKKSYEKITAYGKYIDNKKSICLGKQL